MCIPGSHDQITLEHINSITTTHIILYRTKTLVYGEAKRAATSF